VLRIGGYDYPARIIWQLVLEKAERELPRAVRARLSLVRPLWRVDVGPGGDVDYWLHVGVEGFSVAHQRAEAILDAVARRLYKNAFGVRIGRVLAPTTEGG